MKKGGEKAKTSTPRRSGDSFARCWMLGSAKAEMIEHREMRKSLLSSREKPIEEKEGRV